MKKSIIFLSFISMIVILNSSALIAQPTRFQCRVFLNRSNVVITKAKEAVSLGKVYTGDVVKAVYHQRFARELFRDGKYLRAIHQSYRARVLARIAIKANKGEITKDMELSAEERQLIKNSPDDKTLDGEIKIPQGADDKAVLKDKEADVDDK